MEVLVACEESDVVGAAFRAEGHEVTSCDLLPSQGSPKHVQGDVRPLLRKRWDLVIAHPPCERLTRARGKMGPIAEVLAAIEFFQACLNANAPMVAVENPMMFKWPRLFVGEPDCKSQPYQFGDNFRKATYWWLKGLPPLMPTMDNLDPPLWVSTAGPGSKRNGRPRRTGAVRNSRLRSRFWPGMARAMAVQWGRL